jgi:hypothetical protein
LIELIKVTLPKYHVYIEIQGEKEKSAIRFNLIQEELIRLFVTPFSAGKPFMFCGRLLNPTKVQHVIIFTSAESADTLVLPNREEVANHPDKKFVMSYICRGKVKDVQVCTDRFLPLSKKEEKPV